MDHGLLLQAFAAIFGNCSAEEGCTGTYIHTGNHSESLYEPLLDRIICCEFCFRHLPSVIKLHGAYFDLVPNLIVHSNDVTVCPKKLKNSITYPPICMDFPQLPVI